MFVAVAPLDPFAQPGAPGRCPWWKVTCNPGQGLARMGTAPPAGPAWVFAAMAQITLARRSLAAVLGGGTRQG